MEAHVVVLATVSPRPGLKRLASRTVGQPRQLFCETLIAFRDLLVVKTIQRIRLLQGEQMLWPPSTTNALAYSFALFLQLGSRKLANCSAPRSPWRIASMILVPVSPMISAATSVSLTFICSKAFWICCTWLAA